MFCPNCGTPQQDASSRCGGCGFVSPGGKGHTLIMSEDGSGAAGTPPAQPAPAPAPSPSPIWAVPALAGGGFGVTPLQAPWVPVVPNAQAHLAAGQDPAETPRGLAARGALASFTWWCALVGMGGALTHASYNWAWVGHGGTRPLEHVALEVPLFISSAALAVAGTRVIRGRPAPQWAYAFVLLVFALMAICAEVLFAIAYGEVSVPKVVISGAGALFLALPWLIALLLLVLRSTAPALGAGPAQRAVAPVPVRSWAGPLLLGLVGLGFVPYALCLLTLTGVAWERTYVFLGLGLLVSLPIYPLGLVVGIGLLRDSGWVKKVSGLGAFAGVLGMLLFLAESVAAAFSDKFTVLEVFVALVPIGCAALLPAWVLLELALSRAD